MPSSKPNRKGSGSRVFVRKDGRELKRVGVYIPRELAKALAVHCAQTEQELSEVVTLALERYLS